MHTQGSYLVIDVDRIRQTATHAQLKLNDVRWTNLNRVGRHVTQLIVSIAETVQFNTAGKNKYLQKSDKRHIKLRQTSFLLLHIENIMSALM